MGKDWSERELERLLRRAVDRSVPDVYQAISREPAAPLLNPDGIVPPPMARRRKGLPLALCACVLLALCIGGFGFFHTAAIISIGGGPDLELSVNRFQRVLAASGYSETGETVLSGISLRYQRLDDALETVARSMEEQVCLTGEQDIPVAVDGGDWRYNRELLAVTREVLEDRVAGSGGQAHIVPVPERTALPSVPAAEESETPPAAVLPSVPAVVPTVQPTARPAAVPAPADVGEEGALSAALNRAGLKREDVELTELKREEEDGRTVYELEFRSGDAGFECDVAADGTILKFRREEREPAPVLTVTKQQAWQAAFCQAGCAEEETEDRTLELEEQDGAWYYELEFQWQGREYEYLIDAATGAILEAETGQ